MEIHGIFQLCFFHRWDYSYLYQDTVRSDDALHMKRNQTKGRIVDCMLSITLSFFYKEPVYKELA